jgi:RNA-directed DNA polymerase
MNHNCSTASLIRKINPITIGWGNYYRHAVSKRTYQYCDTYIWQRLMIWLDKKHPNRSKDWKTSTHFRQVNGNKWRFFDRHSGTVLTLMKQIPIKRHAKLLRDTRVYDVDKQEYWINRDEKETDMAVTGKYTRPLYKNQSGKCACCDERFTKTDISNSLHIHHLKPISMGGNWQTSNLRLVHSDCHAQLHSKLTLSDMAKQANSGIDYTINDSASCMR